MEASHMACDFLQHNCGWKLGLVNYSKWEGARSFHFRKVLNGKQQVNFLPFNTRMMESLLIGKIIDKPIKTTRQLDFPQPRWWFASWMKSTCYQHEQEQTNSTSGFAYVDKIWGMEFNLRFISALTDIQLSISLHWITQHFIICNWMCKVTPLQSLAFNF